MKSSREKILSNCPPARAAQEASTAERRRDLLKAVSGARPQDRAALVRRFSEELTGADGEVILVNDLKSAAEAVKTILTQETSDSLAVTDEKECRGITDLLTASMPDLRIQRAGEVQGDERKKMLAREKTALVKASCGIADIGSIAFFYQETGTSYPHFLAETVLVLMSTDQLVADQFALFDAFPESMTNNMVMVNGPSRTADIEKVLILGAHGPRRLIVLLLP